MLRPSLGLGLALALALLAPTGVAPPSYAFSVLIYQATASGTPQSFFPPPGCANGASSATSLTVQCTSPPGFTCDATAVGIHAGIVTPSASSLSLSSFVGWVPGEFVTGTAQCSGGPATTATSVYPGTALAVSGGQNFAFPFTCTATFSASATGAVQCNAP